MLRRLRLKFILINMTIVTLMLITIFFLIYFFTQRSLEEESYSTMRALAENPFSTSAPGDESDEVHLPYFTLQVNYLGEIVATGGGYYDLSDEDFLEELLTAAIESSSEMGTLDEYGLRYYKVFSPQSQYIIFADISSETSTLGSLLKTCVLIGVVAFLVFLGISIILARWAVKPVAAAWDQQKRFIADASHELKTPLTVIITNAEMLEEGTQTPEQRARLSENITTMSGRMKSLVEELLELSREDSRDESAHVRLDYSTAISESLLPFEPVFFEKGLILESDIQEGIFVKGSETDLRRAVEILLDNAGKYALSGGTVEVRLVKNGKHALLSVANTGVPLTENERRNIFKRFYRTDEAREGTGSFGLGLAIAESIVEKHRGRIWAESDVNKNIFYIQLQAVQ